MKPSVAILGSTGSIGKSTLSVLSKNRNYKIILLTTHKNSIKVLKQAIKYKVKNVIITNEKNYKKHRELFKKKNINLYYGINNLKKILQRKIHYTINAIAGIEGLEPTLKIIPHTKNILIANKESIICAWHLILSKLNKHKTNFIPIDSEHFSIWELIKNEKPKNIDKIILTASGGPFLNKSLRKIKNISPKYALKHPNWKMGKKISIDSSNMMNKVLELIEAKKLFNLNKKKLSIIIHPESYVHAIVFFKNDLIKFLAHETKMTIPISNALNATNINSNINIKNNFKKLNKMKFLQPKIKQFPIISLIKKIPDEISYFETILISLNDFLVDKYLNNEINYISIQRNLINLIERPFFKKYYKLKPKNIYDIKNMISITKNYLNFNFKYYYD